MNSHLILCLTMVLFALFAAFERARLPAAERVVLAGPTMGSTYTIQLPELPAHLTREALHREVEALLEEISATFSLYRNDSELLRIQLSPADEWIPLSPRMFFVLQAARNITMESNGAFDITVAPLVELWSLPKHREPPTTQELSAALENVGNDVWELRQEPPAVRKLRAGMKFNVNGCVPGYAIDCLAELLERHRLHNFLIELGGEVRAQGHSDPTEQGWLVGLESPAEAKSVSTTNPLSLRNQALATSGDYRQFRVLNQQKVSHIIDPRSGKAMAYRGLAVSVWSSDCLTADAWATAFCVIGPERGIEWANEREMVVCFQMVEEQASGIQLRASRRFEQAFPALLINAPSAASAPSHQPVWFIVMGTSVVLGVARVSVLLKRTWYRQDA